MICMRVATRFLHLQPTCLAAEKSLLSSLRKKTGYTFSNCKKALEMHDNDLGQAEKWLRQQAQALGWSKATKLEGRQTTQGLIGVVVRDKSAALVEVNCETDFVARNQEFKKVVEEAADSCVNFVENHNESGGPLLKVNLNAEQLKNLQGRDGKSLADHLALMIGTVGENASLKRALSVKAEGDLHLAAYAHPSGGESNNGILLGKFGGFVALRQTSPKEGVNLDEIGKQLCQHIVGMNPKKIGTDKDEPAKEKDEETCLIHQDFLLDDDLTVKEVLEENQIEIVDFKRFECGENVSPSVELEFVETCQ